MKVNEQATSKENTVGHDTSNVTEWWLKNIVIDSVILAHSRTFN